MGSMKMLSVSASETTEYLGEKDPSGRRAQKHAHGGILTEKAVPVLAMCGKQ